MSIRAGGNKDLLEVARTKQLENSGMNDGLNIATREPTII